MSSFELRPHHGLCTAFFEGRGYSPAFIRHMTAMIAFLDSHNPDIRLVLHTDRICSACPHNKDGLCESSSKVTGYDRQVLTLCGLQENQQLSWKNFQELVFLNILRRGLLCTVCRDCQWLFLCSEKNKKFLTTPAYYDKIEL